MCGLQLLRESVRERMMSAAEAFLLQLEKGAAEAAGVPALRALLTERLTAAAEEIVALLEETVAEYEERVQRSEREICRQRRLLDAVMRIHRADDHQPLESRGDVPQEDTEAPPIKEEQDELWSSPADGTKFPFSPVLVKSEDDDDDEEKLQSAQLYQRQSEEESGADGEDCGGAGLERDSGSEGHLPPKTQVKTKVSSRSETADGADDWISTRQPESNSNSVTDEGGGTPEEPLVCFREAESDGDSDPTTCLGPVSEENSMDSAETDDSDLKWTQTSGQSGSDGQKHSEAAESDLGSPEKERPFPCSYCGKRFSLKGNLNRHIRDHTGERPFPCSSCEKSFKDSGSLTAHMRCHTGEQPYSCLFCGKNFSGRGNMTRHMRIHTGEKPFTCTLCSKSFHVKEHLNRHIKYHTGEKPFSCSVCGKGCAQKTDLKKHMRVHTGEKPFSCPFCGKCCAEKGDLTKHMRVHTGEKPFSCNICGKSCAQKGSLKIHMRVHTGEKPFSCLVCGKRFTVTGHLKRHMKLHMAADGQEAEPTETEPTKGQQEVGSVDLIKT
ncbi:zinc finger and SCAN domain-containing protein 2-like [Cheilinus undulatus]|uniref:zinc finger and SCAN domain-containing protein 2-like n=1 Tax=Cheilinus undulatus TaxID=241271 RepID=UPI001BD1E298|nr:zinc finger and SCAN domain-containing protein 2-like [Cheilinus undulatus]